MLIETISSQLKALTERREIPEVSVDNEKGIQELFDAKIPFVIKGAQLNPHGVNSDFLRRELGQLKVSCFSPEYTSEHMQLDELLYRIQRGEKYRLRADVSLGRKLQQYFDANFFQKVRRNQKTLMDMVLHWLANKKWAVFLSSPFCKMSNHAHINSNLVLQLEGKKTWHIGFRKLRDIEHKNVYPYDYLAEKRPDEEIEVTLTEGDVLYMPAYWFHYTDTTQVSLSMHYLFAESLSYYFSPRILPLFLYELIHRPLGMMKLALARDNEFEFGDKKRWLKTRSQSQIKFLEGNDFS